MDGYVSQLHKFAERLSKLMCENLGLDEEERMNAFSHEKSSCCVTFIKKIKVMSGSSCFSHETITTPLDTKACNMSSHI
ncbi:hypothetical protein AALP_AA3G360400 [Arabis alpina]|uniref:Uncharacterized protein n=1 Tax=Arabis alpina TaxID=50452 RepID=A0A087HDY0_ARAAL|nr:hypothetical protein AALP_AA3G360400 [Arabis alpina]